MARDRSRGGEGKLGCVIWLLILAVFATFCWQFIPVQLHSSELKDYMETQAERAGSRSPEEIKARVLKRAKDLKLPVRAKDLKVERAGGRVRMECAYSVQIEFFFYTHQMDFDYVVDRPVFVF